MENHRTWFQHHGRPTYVRQISDHTGTPATRRVYQTVNTLGKSHHLGLRHVQSLDKLWDWSSRPQRCHSGLLVRAPLLRPCCRPSKRVEHIRSRTTVCLFEMVSMMQSQLMSSCPHAILAEPIEPLLAHQISTSRPSASEVMESLLLQIVPQLDKPCI